MIDPCDAGGQRSVLPTAEVCALNPSLKQGFRGSNTGYYNQQPARAIPYQHCFSHGRQLVFDLVKGNVADSRASSHCRVAASTGTLMESLHSVY